MEQSHQVSCLFAESHGKNIFYSFEYGRHKIRTKNIGRIRVNIYVWKIYMPLYAKCCHPHKIKSLLTCICTYFNTNNQYEGEVGGGGGGVL